MSARDARSRGRRVGPAVGLACAAGALWATGAGAARAAELDPPVPAAAYPAVSRLTDVAIAMRDGTVLHADVLRPADAHGRPAPGRFPVILTQTPYNKQVGARAGDAAAGGLFGESPFLVRHGYVQVMADVRGTGDSGGTWQILGPAEQADSAELARWAVSRPWSDGHLGLYGYSYGAINQFLTAAADPPGLDALFAGVPAEDLYRDVAFPGGDADIGFLPYWLGLVQLSGLFTDTLLARDPAAAAVDLVTHAIGNLGPAEGSLVDGVLEGDLAFDGPFYRVRSPGGVVGTVRAPTFVVGGWHDLFQRGEPRLYQALRLAPGRRQLLMGPWYHLTAGDGLGRPGAPAPLQSLALLWFDRWLKGTRNGIDATGPVTSYVLGTGRWVTYPTWPPPGVAHPRLYLSSRRSDSARSLNDGSLSSRPPDRAGADGGLADQLSGLCSLSTAQWTAGVLRLGPGCEGDNRAQELDSLTYTTPVLRRPLHLAGPVGVTLHGSTTAGDATWMASLTDVAPGGRSRVLTSGWLLSSRRALDRARSERTRSGDVLVPFHPFTRDSVLPVRPSEPETLRIEVLNTDAVLAPGHRLRLVVAAGDFPHMGSTAQVSLRKLTGVSTVLHSPRSPSYVTLSVAP